jgi:hypothetical protein
MKQENVLYNPAGSLAGHRDRPVSSGKRNAEELLLLCITDCISPAVQEKLGQLLEQPVSWSYLLNLAAFHGVIPMVSHNLTASGFSSRISQPYREELRQVYSNEMYRNLILTRELDSVLTVLSQHSVAAITLKGTPLTETLYGNPALRMIADIDILVHAEDIPLARKVLSGLGYCPVDAEQFQDHPFHGVPYRKEGVFPFYIELHWALEDSRILNAPSETLWSRAQKMHLPGLPTTVLSPEDNFLFMANHLSKSDYHLLKFLGDITRLLNKYRSSLDWEYIIEAAHAWQVGTAVYCALRRARDILGVPVPSSPLEALKPSGWRCWLLNLLLDEETFVSPIRWQRLRGWTTVLARCLMVGDPHRILAVLSRRCGPDKKSIWLKTAFWTILVFLASLWRYCTKYVAKGARRLMK